MARTNRNLEKRLQGEMMKRSLLALVVLTAATVMAPVASGAPDVKPAQPVNLQILSVSDWHAQLEPEQRRDGARRRPRAAGVNAAARRLALSARAAAR